jgi:aspartyl-tRNA(Asn)/glutamyl-tRNA(Gln) amidotransferase subunit A
MQFYDLTALELGAKIKNKEIGVREVTAHILENISEQDGFIRSYITVNNAEALVQADKLQAAINEGKLVSPLAGVPMAVKDNICTKNMPTTCASKMLENFKPPYNATVVDKLEEAGALILGKLNMDEFAMGSTTETSYFGQTRNPWDFNKSPGGSSGGAAAAVASGEAFYTLGSDTGGSIRQPCSFCGVTGIKPTYGRVSRYGLIAYASSLDQIGPIATTAKDCQAILKMIEGWDVKDSTSVKPIDAKGFTVQSEELPLKGLKVGIPENYMKTGIDPEVRKAILATARSFEMLGANCEEFPMPIVEYAIPAYYIIASAEASSNLSRYDGIKYGFRPENFDDLSDLYLKARSQGFGMEVKRRIMLGAFTLSSGYYDAYYKKALQVKNLIKQAFDKAFGQYHVLLGPTAPDPAPRLGESLKDPLKMYLGDICTVSVNLAGLPSITAPCGFSQEGMPIGLQLIGKAFDENTLFKVVEEYQNVTDYHRKRPEVAGKIQALLKDGGVTHAI